jgi:predicted secreted protein
MRTTVKLILLALTVSVMACSKSNDDNSINRLNIVITDNKAMDHIQDDWVIISISNTEIRLKDDNPASMEELHFGRTNQS